MEVAIALFLVKINLKLGTSIYRYTTQKYRLGNNGFREALF